MLKKRMQNLRFFSARDLLSNSGTNLTQVIFSFSASLFVYILFTRCVLYRWLFHHFTVQVLCIPISFSPREPDNHEYIVTEREEMANGRQWRQLVAPCEASIRNNALKQVSSTSCGSETPQNRLPACSRSSSCWEVVRKLRSKVWKHAGFRGIAVVDMFSISEAFFEHFEANVALLCWFIL